MKLLSTLVLAATVVASGAAGAAYSSDQDRRDQNREEALSKWRAHHGELASAGEGNGRQTTLRQRASEGAGSVRNFTHRQADKARRFAARHDRKQASQ